jgi:glycosyltransferase involved in cell wall biosynthesis
MKVLHLATYDTHGGAARAAYRQHRALLAAGVNSRMLVRHKFSNDKTVDVFFGNRGLIHRIHRTLIRSGISYLRKKNRSHGSAVLTDPRADLIRKPTTEMLEADVINFHKTEKFVDIISIFSVLPPEKPIVLTLHDISPMSGGCDYPGDCVKFMERCGKCPILKSTYDNDYSRKIFHLRQSAYFTRNSNRFALVANSQWTSWMAKKSSLTRSFRINVINLCLDGEVYSPELRSESRLALGISPNQSVLAFAAHNVDAALKGGQNLKEALHILAKKHSLHLLTMGGGHFEAPEGCTHTHFGKIESDEFQALIYRAANVFVIPSLEEAFGQTALEAAACGTLVAGFSVGGVVDIVKNGFNGQLVSRGDSVALSQAIISLLENREMQRLWTENASIWIRDNFSYQRNACAYISLYSDLVKGF